MTTESLPVLAILGGTGDLGTGLARRWAQAGYRVIIGSRTQEKAEQAASDLRQVMAARGATVHVESMENLAAAEAADIVAITVPFSHQKSTLELVAPALQGQILIDVTVPLVSAFQNVAAAHLQDEGAVDCDVLVCGNKKEARAAVITLVEAAGLRGFHAGMIANAAAAEALTSVLITINKQYSCHAGIRISGLDSHG